jgi:ATP-dependent helicase HrpA
MNYWNVPVVFFIQMHVDGAYNRDLPIFKKRDEIIEAVRCHQVVIVAGETGCGKTTQLPFMCFEAAKAGRIAVTQPRRIAAISLARYLSGVLPGAPPGTIGYKVRFQETVNSATRIAFVTDGVILAETNADRLLRRYGAIIIDEAHERTVPIDFLLGYMRVVLPQRPELRVIIASATLDTKLFSRSFFNAPVITVSGRRYPVEVRWEPVIGLWRGSAMRSHVDGVIHAVRSILDTGDPGDILAFLPTVEDIHECMTGIIALTKNKACAVMPLYGRMDPRQQGGIFRRDKQRRIILATNIAETSITVPGIRFVVDTGLARCVRFDPNAGIDRMPVERVSRASADQRAGRCGRVENGVCIRLFSRGDYEARPRYALPEIRRANLAGVLLRMAALSIGAAERFPFLQRPSFAAIAAGRRQLRALDAIDNKGKLTRLGRAMSALPLDPAIARMLLYARGHGAFHEAAIIASALSAGDLWSGRPALASVKPRRAGPGDGVSDFSALIDLWRDIPRNGKGLVSRRRLEKFCAPLALNSQRVKEWANIHRQLLRICGRMAPVKKGPPASYEALHKSLLCAFAGSIAVIQESGLYRTARMHDIMVPSGSRCHGKRRAWVLFHDIVETKRPFARYAAEVLPQWIRELFPRQCRAVHEGAHFDPERGAVLCLRQVLFNGLQIVKDQTVDYAEVRPGEAAEIFIEEALAEGKIGKEYGFLEHNRKMRETVEAAGRKVRVKNLYSDNALARFYGERLPGVHSVAQLDGLIGRAKNDRFLRMSEEDLCEGPLPKALSEYPDAVIVAGERLPIVYSFDPDDEADGATVILPKAVYDAVPLYYWEWLLPAFLRPRLEAMAALMARGLSREELAAGVGTVVESLSPGKGPFIDQALPALAKAFGAAIGLRPMDIAPRQRHVWLRLSIVDERGAVADTFRPPISGPSTRPVAHTKAPALWRQWCGRWEQESLRAWDGLRALREVVIQPPGQPVPVWGVTGFSIENKRVAVRVFFSKGAAYAHHRKAIRLLLENELNEKIAWAWRDFARQHRVPYRLQELMESFGLNGVLETLFGEIVLMVDYAAPEDAEGFEGLKKTAEARLAQAGTRALGILSGVAPEYATCSRLLDKYGAAGALTAAMKARLDDLSGKLRQYREGLVAPMATSDRIEQLPRYLRAFACRIQAANDKPLRYEERRAQLHEYRSALCRARGAPDAALPENARRLDELEAMIEEYAIALFADGKVSLRFPVSEQRLQKCKDECLSEEGRLANRLYDHL